MSIRIRPTLSYADAIKLMREPGRKLIVTHLKHGPKYSVTPGGPITLSTPRRLLEQCREVDPGLLPGLPQTWRLER